MGGVEGEGVCNGSREKEEEGSWLAVGSDLKPGKHPVT